MRSLPVGWNSVLAKLGFTRKKRKKQRLSNPFALRPRMECLEDRRVLAMLTVNSLGDTHINTNGVLSLREAIEVVQQGNTTGLDSTTITNQISGSVGTNNTIRFASSLNNQTIDLSLGQISYSRSGTTLTIDASLLDSLIVDANASTPSPTGRILNITDASSGTNPSLVTLAGLTLTGGGTTLGGGAIRSEACLVIRDCIFENNEADTGGAIFVQVAGGGATAREVLKIENSIFDYNDAFTGGAIAVISGTASTAVNDTIFLSNTDITNNKALSGDGGGIYAQLYGADLKIVDGDFFMNEADSGNGGGLFVQTDSNVGSRFGEVSISGATFSGNTADRGGGIELSAQSTLTAAILTISHTLISGNHATNGEGGGLFANFLEGMFTANKGVFISDSTISGNDSVFDGGGVFVGLGKSGFGSHNVAVDLQFSMTRTVVEDNEAGNRGGGMFLYGAGGSEIAVRDSRISGNKTGLNFGIPYLEETQRNYSGGGIYAYTVSGPQGELVGTKADESLVATVTISGTTVDNNQAGVDGGGILIYTKRGGALAGKFSMSISTVSGNTAGKPMNPNPSQGRGGGIHLATFDSATAPDADEGIDARLHNVTVTKNTAGVGGGIYSTRPIYSIHSVNQPTVMDVRLKNTIVSQNAGHNALATNFWGCINVDQAGFNLIGPTNVFYHHNTRNLLSTAEVNALFNQSVTGNILNSNNVPMLAPLADNGGGFALPDGSHVWTHRPISGSPVIDKGSNTKAIVPFTDAAPVELTTDQRGVSFPRRYDVAGVNPAGVNVDIGAHEVGLAKVVDVILDNPTWVRDPHSFAEVIPLGEQLRPFATQNVTQIQIRFSDHVRKKNAAGTPSDIISTDGALLELKRTIRNADGSITNETVTSSSFGYEPATATATWTFNTPLVDGKYAIHLKVAAAAVAGIVDAAGQDLDSEWTNDPGFDVNSDPTWDDYTDDPRRPFATGSGTAGTTGGAFRFHFGLLAGDYDGDGLVEHDGESATGDGDGIDGVTSTDITINTIGKRLPLQKIRGADFNGDEIVDYQDLLIWQASYGVSGNADADGDGDTDGRDFLLWQRVIGSESAWYDPAFDTMVAATTVGLPPQVMNVIISGSMSVHAPFSFDTVDGSGTQLNTVPVAKSDTISIVFSENVNVSATSLIVVGLTTANVPKLAAFSYDPVTFTATWRFEGWALGDNYLLHLADSITDTEGNFLDGEWTNPLSTTTTNTLVSEFPSGDGVSGGAFVFVMTLLPGDLNLDAVVNNTDYDLYIASLMQGGGTLFIHGDFSGNGTVSNMDTGLFVANWLTDLREIFVLADLNQDGKVDGDDLGILGNNYGMTGADWEDGDLNGDTVVDDLDLDLAFAQFGLTLYNTVA